MGSTTPGAALLPDAISDKPLSNAATSSETQNEPGPQPSPLVATPTSDHPSTSEEEQSARETNNAEGTESFETVDAVYQRILELVCTIPSIITICTKIPMTNRTSSLLWRYVTAIAYFPHFALALQLTEIFIDSLTCNERMP